MGTVRAWHSARPGTEVYHNNSACTEENNIEPYNVNQGTGNLRLCKHCERLNAVQQFNLFGAFGRSSLFAAALKKKQ